MPAQVFGFAQKGEISVGKDADLTLFDAEKICDKADYPHRGAPEFPYVFVDGVLTVKNGEYTGACSGKIIKK